MTEFSARPSVYVLDHENLVHEYPAPRCTASGSVAAAIAVADGFALWTVRAELTEGSALHWGREHGDEAVYVVDGELEVRGERCDPGGLVIVEAGIEATVTVAKDGAHVVHVGGAATGAHAGAEAVAGERGVHVMPRDIPTAIYGGDNGDEIGVRIFADGTSPSCSLNFLFNWGTGASRIPAHSHSEDEMIHVLTGELHVGPMIGRAGSTIAIRADLPYAFRTSGAYSFVNYRERMSWMKLGSDPVATPETIEWTRSDGGRSLN